MIIKTLAIIAAAALLPLSAAGQQAPAPPPVAASLPHVVLETDLGPVVVELDTARAPITAGNFLRYATEGRFDGTTFYRAVNVAPGYGLVQGGTKGDPAKTLPPVAHEPTSLTGLTHTDATLSMARGAPGSATGDFFIIIGDLVSLDAGDADTAGAGDTLGFAAFGRVVQGMDVVRAIAAAPTSATAGEGAMKGQMLDPPVVIRGTRVVPADAARPDAPPAG